jgi:hypothetical protein
MPVCHKALQPIDIIESPIQLNQCLRNEETDNSPFLPLFSSTFCVAPKVTYYETGFGTAFCLFFVAARFCVVSV